MTNTVRLYRELDSKRIAAAVGIRHAVGIEATEQLAAFVAKRSYALPFEYVINDGTYDLHPDIRFAPGEAPPID